jgi:hypothetical protein
MLINICMVCLTQCEHENLYDKLNHVKAIPNDYSA